MKVVRIKGSGKLASEIAYKIQIEYHLRFCRHIPIINISWQFMQRENWENVILNEIQEFKKRGALFVIIHTPKETPAVVAATTVLVDINPEPQGPSDLHIRPWLNDKTLKHSDYASLIMAHIQTN